MLSCQYPKFYVATCEMSHVKQSVPQNWPLKCQSHALGLCYFWLAWRLLWGRLPIIPTIGLIICWRGGLVVKSAFCFFRGPKFSFQHAHWTCNSTSHAAVTPAPGALRTLLWPLYMSSSTRPHTDRHACTSYENKYKSLEIFAVIA